MSSLTQSTVNPRNFYRRHTQNQSASRNTVLGTPTTRVPPVTNATPPGRSISHSPLTSTPRSSNGGHSSFNSSHECDISGASCWNADHSPSREPHSVSNNDLVVMIQEQQALLQKLVARLDNMENWQDDFSAKFSFLEEQALQAQSSGGSHEESKR